MKVYVNENYLKSSKLDGNYKIINLSDTHFRGDKFLHNIEMGLKKIAELKPNLIVISGDFIDSLEYGVNYKSFLREYLEYLSSICPTVMSFGSHDLELFLNHSNRDALRDERRKYQEEYFAFLDSISDDFYPIFPESTKRIDLDNISIFGYSYPDIDGPNIEKIHGNMEHMKRYLNDMDISRSRYNILLCHSPLAFFDDKCKVLGDCKDFDLVLSGHEHAGMMPHCLKFLPFGIIGPDRELFPVNIKGVHFSEEGTCVDISSGFLKVPGLVIEDVHVIGSLLYKANNLYANEMDLLNINGEKKIIKKMG